MTHTGGTTVFAFTGFQSDLGEFSNDARVESRLRSDYQFLGRVGIVAKTFARDAREAGRVGRPVRKFVRLCRRFDT